MLSIERLIGLKTVIKWNAVFAEAGLNPNTMRSAIHNRRDLRKREVAALMRVLKQNGIVLEPLQEPTLFPDRIGDEPGNSHNGVE